MHIYNQEKYVLLNTLFVLKFAKYLNLRRPWVRETKTERKILRANSSDSKKLDLR